ncbi:MAG: 3-dehydroquinate synthase [Chlamydiae bacterium CG10_big_fil_rev_8_21_14_0_10_42_34]|nr:MAG: 3-dehydroquinate synthase [Chlamydiae bacterium CG10_big_fil_rev_8_21_14_0_10_42_34]
MGGKFLAAIGQTARLSPRMEGRGLNPSCPFKVYRHQVLPIDILFLMKTLLSTKLYFSLNTELCLDISKTGVILVDESIAKTHGKALQKTLGYEMIAVPSGERSKTRETKQRLEDELLRRKIGKKTLLIALGGGVTTDLVGFLSSTYLRGVPLILIPTTLLGMVDAAIGGKTGVNTPFGKNLIGALYPPVAVFIVFDFLKTLPEKEIKNGLSEILKYGLTHDPMIWEISLNGINKGLIETSIRCKLKIVSQDYDERLGLRHTLNFGHTVGHALELLSNFKMSHGEAVALGCMAESFLSHLLGYLPTRDLDEILERYQRLGYGFKQFDRKAFFNALMVDKKVKNGSPRFVLLEKIGKCVPFEGSYCKAVAMDDLEKMVEWMHANQN